MWDMKSLRMRKTLITEKLKKKRKNITKAGGVWAIQYFSQRDILREQRRSNEVFESMIMQLSLEELIGLKMELAVRAAGGKMNGYPLWDTLPTIVKDAMMRFALSVCSTPQQIAMFLGCDSMTVLKMIIHWDKELKQLSEKQQRNIPDYMHPIRRLIKERFQKWEGAIQSIDRTAPLVARLYRDMENHEAERNERSEETEGPYDNEGN